MKYNEAKIIWIERQCREIENDTKTTRTKQIQCPRHAQENNQP
jgi:hypothetical protein